MTYNLSTDAETLYDSLVDEHVIVQQGQWLVQETIETVLRKYGSIIYNIYVAIWFDKPLCEPILKYFTVTHVYKRLWRINNSNANFILLQLYFNAANYIQDKNEYIYIYRVV